MATLRTAVAAAARASSRRGSGLAGSRGGAGSGLAVLSSRGGAGSVLAVLSSRGGGGSLQLVRAFSDGGKIPKGQDPFWSWKTWRAKADELHDAVFSAPGLLYMFCTTSAGFAIYYVDRAIAEERRNREAFERRALKCHQDLVERTITNIEKLKEKMGSFWDRFLLYREDDIEHRGAVTKAADTLKSKGYVILPASDLEMMKSQIAELTLSMAEMRVQGKVCF